MVKSADDGKELFLNELCMKAQEMSTIAHVRHQELCAEVLTEEYPLVFSS
jgi:hypothetical protein